MMLIAMICLLALSGIDGARLKISGHHFHLDDARVFLSGINQAWVNYGYDFGNGQYSGVKAKYEDVLDKIQAAGGNSNRIWVHIEGQTSPHFTADGMVDGTDADGTLIDELREYIRAAEQRNVFIFITLWNGAAKGDFHDRLDGLIKDEGKLQSYLDNALIPMVEALKGEPGLGGWDIMNEPEGEMIPEASENPCEDTSLLADSGMGWEGKLYTAKEIQRFTNWQVDAIRKTDPEALVSIGAWKSIANTDSFGFHDLYKDECLLSAGGRTNGTVNFYQFHSYAWQGNFNGYSPFEHRYGDYTAHGKPIVVGEFSGFNGGDYAIDLYNKSYEGGYAGAWIWSETDAPWSTIEAGLNFLRDKNNPNRGGLVKLTI